MQIKNRPPVLPERGKIKIGRKGPKRKSSGGKEFSPPVKLDHFIITTMARDADDNFVPDVDLMQAIAEKTGQDAKRLTRIPIRLLYNDPALNFVTRYAAYKGKTRFCSGDGEVGSRLGQDGSYASCPCTCERLDQDYNGKPKCKINGNLSVLIDGAAGIGGVHKFRTTSFNSVDGLAGSLQFISQITGGHLSNLPLDMVVSPKQVTAPNGSQQTVHIVGLEYAGTMPELREAGYQNALEAKQADLRIEYIEDEVRKSMGKVQDGVFSGETADDLAGEFIDVEGEEAEAAPDLKSPMETPTSDDPPAGKNTAPKRGRPAGAKNKKKDTVAPASDAVEQNAQLEDDGDTPTIAPPTGSSGIPPRPPPIDNDSDVF